MTRIGLRPVHAPVRRGTNRGNDSRTAAEAHHTLSPGWTPVRVFARSGRPVMRFQMQAPPRLPWPAFSGPLHARASGSTRPAGRGWALGQCYASLDPLARACGLGALGFAPHAEPSRLGVTTTTATGVALPAVSARLPPAIRRPCGHGAASRAAAGRLAPPNRQRRIGGPPTAPPCLDNVAARLWLAAKADPRRLRGGVVGCFVTQHADARSLALYRACEIPTTKSPSTFSLMSWLRCQAQQRPSPVIRQKPLRLVTPNVPDGIEHARRCISPHYGLRGNWPVLMTGFKTPAHLHSKHGQGGC